MPRAQFTLRALLVAMLVVGAFFAWVAHTASFVRARGAVLRESGGRLSVIHEIGAETEPKELPWIRRLLGDEPIPALFDALAEPNRE